MYEQIFSNSSLDTCTPANALTLRTFDARPAVGGDRVADVTETVVASIQVMTHLLTSAIRPLTFVDIYKKDNAIIIIIKVYGYGTTREEVFMDSAWMPIQSIKGIRGKAYEINVHLKLDPQILCTISIHIYPT